MITIKNVLVATDFSPSSENALVYGRELARQFNARLQVIHVLNNVYTQVFTGEASLAESQAGHLQRSLEQSGRRQLEAFITDEDRWRFGAKTVLPVGSVAHEIVTYARSAGIDIIVMGTHGRGLVAHALMGSVAEKVVRTAPCPVLTVRHPERELVVADAIGNATPAAM
jgi:nucleotide-binding universal stress UspA family protein